MSLNNPFPPYQDRRVPFQVSAIPGIVASPDNLRGFGYPGIPSYRIVPPQPPTTGSGVSTSSSTGGSGSQVASGINGDGTTNIHAMWSSATVLTDSSVSENASTVFTDAHASISGFVGISGASINNTDVLGYVPCHLDASFVFTQTGASSLPITTTSGGNEMRGYQSTMRYTRTANDSDWVSAPGGNPGDGWDVMCYNGAVSVENMNLPLLGGKGTCTASNAVNSVITWVSGTNFLSSWSGHHILINGVRYPVLSFSSGTSITVTGNVNPAGTLGTVNFMMGNIRGQMKPFQSEIYFKAPAANSVYAYAPAINYVASLSEFATGNNLDIWCGYLVGQPNGSVVNGVTTGYGLWIQNLDDGVHSIANPFAIKIDGLGNYGRISWNSSNILESAAGTLQLFGSTRVQTAASCGLFVGGSTANAGLQCGSATAFGPVVSSNQTGGSVPTASGYNAEFQGWMTGATNQLGITTQGATGACFMLFDHLGRTSSAGAANTGQWRWRNGGLDGSSHLYLSMILNADGSLVLPQQGADESAPGTFDFNNGAGNVTYSTGVMYFKSGGLYYRLSGGSPVGPLAAGAGGSGTGGQLSAWTGVGASTTLGNSIITDGGTNVSIPNGAHYDITTGTTAGSGYYVGGFEIITPVSGGKASIGNINAITGSGTFLTTGHFDGGYLLLTEGAAPATAAGQGAVYTKTDHHLYYRPQSNGAEVQLDGGGGGGVTGSGTSGNVALWNGASSLTNSIMTDNGSAIILTGTNHFDSAGGYYVSTLAVIDLNRNIGNIGNAIFSGFLAVGDNGSGIATMYMAKDVTQSVPSNLYAIQAAGTGKFHIASGYPYISLDTTSGNIGTVGLVNANNGYQVNSLNLCDASRNLTPHDVSPSGDIFLSLGDFRLSNQRKIYLNPGGAFSTTCFNITNPGGALYSGDVPAQQIIVDGFGRSCFFSYGILMGIH